MIGRISVLCVGFTVLAAGLAGQEPLKFMGRTATITDPGTEDKEGFFPKGPASLCLEGTPRQCYTMPDKIGRNPNVEVVPITANLSAILFSADSGGVSGFGYHFALLRPARFNRLEDLFRSQVNLSNESEYAFWTEPEISEAKIFVTADFEWGPDEAHYDSHRYIVSAYLFLPASLLDGQLDYYLQDRYMTVRKYDYDDDEHDDILAAEKPEILARLNQVKRQRPAVR